MKFESNLILNLDEDIKISQKDITLLKEIDKFHSITQAAKNLNISYKNAWDRLNIISKNNNFIIRKKIAEVILVMKQKI